MWIYNDNNPGRLINPETGSEICLTESGKYFIEFNIKGKDYANWIFDTKEERDQTFKNLKFVLLNERGSVV